jgi:hypothetical protein
MKNLSFILLLTFFLTGCFSDNSVVTPELNSINTVYTKAWIPIEDTGIPTDREIVITQNVDGSSGGVILYDDKVGNITVKGSLTVPVNAFNGIMEISATFDNRNTTQIFGPSPFEFQQPLLLTLEYTGVNLNGVNPSEIDFYFIGTDGQYYKAEYSSIEVNPSLKLLKVVNAQLNHFSRWGWAK